MADDDIRLRLFLEAHRESIKQVHSEIQRDLKKVKLTLEPEIAAKLEVGDILGVGTGKLQSEIAKITDKQVTAGAQIIEAQEQHTEALLKLTKKSNDSAKTIEQAKKIDEKYLKAVNTATANFSKLGAVSAALGEALNIARDAAVLASTRIGSLKPEALTEALDVVSFAANKATQSFFASKGKGRGGESAASAFEVGQARLSEVMSRAAKIFEDLGFTAKEQSDLFRLAMREFVSKLGDYHVGEIIRGAELKAGNTLLDEIAGEVEINLSKFASIPNEFERAANDSLRRIKARAFQRDRVINPTTEIDGIQFDTPADRQVKVGRDLAKARVFIVQDAVRAEKALIKELYAQADGLISAVEASDLRTKAEQELAKRQLGMAEGLLDSSKRLELMGRPIVPLIDRLDDVIVAFGDVPETLRKFKKNLDGGSGTLLEGLNEARAILKQFGSNFEQVAEFVLPDLKGDDAQDFDKNKELDEKRADLVRQLTEAYQRELKTSNDSAKSNSKLVAARERTSKAFLADAKPVINAELETFRKEVSEAVKAFDGAGIGLVRLGSTATSFEVDFERVKAQFIASLDANKVAFFESAGQGEILSAAIAKLSKNFEGEFFGELRKVADEQAREAQRIARIDRKVALAREEVLKKQQELLNAIQRSILDEDEARRKKPGAGLGFNPSAIRDLKLPDFYEIADRITAPSRDAFARLATAVGNAADSIKNRPLISQNRKVIEAESQNLLAANDRIEQNKAIYKEYAQLKDSISKTRKAIQEEEKRQKPILDKYQREFDAIFTGEGGRIAPFKLPDGTTDRNREMQVASELSSKYNVLDLWSKRESLQRDLYNLEEKEAAVRRKSGDAARELLVAQQDARDSERKIARARDEIARLEQKRVAQVASTSGQGGQARRTGSANNLIETVKKIFAKQREETVKTELKSFGDIERVGVTLNPSAQERFLKALRGEGTSLKELNVLLKQHQGNLAKSSALVDRMTSSMRAGEKAAFQFGFAAANAAERLTAWASPAVFLFETISLLREATTNIIRLDTELRKLVFFSPEYVASQIASLRGLDESVQQRIFTDERYAEALSSSAGSAELARAKNDALASSFDLLINRSRDTGLALEDISSGLLATARVGQNAFERNAQTGELVASSFFEAVEAFKRLEGAAANTDTVVSLLNSTLNEFELSAENAVSVTAAVADAAAKSALEGQELFDVLVRTGGAFNLLTGASVAESLAVIQRATEANIPSVSKLATAIRQFTTLAIENSDAIERFSGIKLVEGGQIKDMETFTSVLQELNDLAPAARNEFLSLFSERDTGATILALATRAKELKGDLLELGDANSAAARASDQTKRFLEQQLFQQEDLNSSINKLKASLTLLVKDSGFIDFLRGTITGLVGAADSVGGLARFLNETIGLFKLLGALAAPTILNILKGFRQGFLERQNSYKVEQEILGALTKQLGATEAVNRAEQEGLISQQQAMKFRRENLELAALLTKTKAEEEIIQAELNALKRLEGVETTRIVTQEQKLAALEQKKANILRDELALRTQIEKTTTSGLAKAQSQISGTLKNAFIGAGVLAAVDILPNAVGSVVGRISQDKKVGDEIGSAIQSAVLGAIGGSAFGGVGAVLGAAVGGIGAIINSRREAGKTAAEQARIQIQADKAAALELQNINRREEIRAKTAEDVSNAQKEVQNTLVTIERLEVEINRVGAERAESEGLLLERTELQGKLIQQQLQLREREKAELEESVKFEERRAAVRERLLSVEKALGVLRTAEIGLAKSFGNTKLEAQLELKFDLAEINLQKRALEQELSEVVNRLAAVRADVTGGKSQEIKSLEKERLRIAGEIARIDIDKAQKNLEGAERIAEVNKSAAEEQIDAWSSAAGQVTSAFRDFVSSQLEVTKIVERQGEIFASIIEEENRVLERALSGPSNTLNANDREQQLVRLQSSAINRQIANINNILRSQRLELNPQFAFDIERQSAEFRQALAKANVGLGQFGDNIELSDRKIFKALENQRAALETNVNLAKSQIQLELDFTNRLIELRRKEIDNLGRAVELQRKKNEQDADFGRKLLQTPDEFLKEIKNIATAQRFFRGIQPGDIGGIERRIRGLQENSRAGGFVVLRQVLEGLQSAVNQGLVVQEGFSPERLLEVFSRLQFQGTGDIRESESEEQKLLSQMDQLNKSIVEKFDRQIALLEEEKSIQRYLQETATAQLNISAGQQAQLEALVSASISEAKKTRDDARALQSDATVAFNEALSELNLVDKVTRGEGEIRDAVNALHKVMAEIRDADPDVRNRRNELKELGFLALNLQSIRRPEGTADQSKAVVSNLKNQEKNITQQLEFLRGELSKDGGLRDQAESITQKANALFGQPGRPGVGQLPFLVTSPVSGKETTAELAIAETEKAIDELEQILLRTVDDRKEAEKQLGVLQRIEADSKRMADLQEKLLFKLSDDPRLRDAEATQLMNGFVPGPITTSASAATSRPIPTEVVNPPSSLPSSRGAPADRVDTPSTRPQTPQERAIELFNTYIERAMGSLDENMRKIVESTLSGRELDPSTPTRELLAEIERLRGFVSTLVKQQKDDRDRTTTRTREPIKIDDESVNNLRTSMNNAFETFTENFFASMDTKLSSIDVNVSPVTVQLDARIQQQLQGDEFAQQLVAAVQGTGLEDKVSEIQGVVAKLVKTALDRGENFSGVDMVGFGGGQLT